MKRTISFRKARMDDIALVHKWMNEDHVHPFWQLNLPFDRFEKHYRKALLDTHQTLYLGMIDGEVMSYWEAYWVQGDVLENAYSAKASDQGIHLLIGEKVYLGSGFALPLLRAMVRFQFQQKLTTKVVAEPDIRNDKMIHIFERCGFAPIAPIRLPDKEAQLMFCEREAFEKRWNDEDRKADL
ncbi:GNAT family N-acetyltransferase [Halobacillus sp. HZG1]|uniref:GNAT family N-acetyltransferase n=1 Tax=Halobacillus sp. HZG1 TaxID=3111769 RepID=UPI002DC01E11|nr:GNAT family N-acetyltransferase [Halobacillus sp. HZG1]MEC3885757.1 GNAT family N-acetyltransferase [Halobacillus sp. HZG1]